MSNREEKIKKLIKDVAVTADKEPIEDGKLIRTVAAMAAATFFTFRALGAEQHSALLASTSVIYLLSLS